MSEDGSIPTSNRKRSSDLHSDEKSQTFRRRRLSLSNLTAVAALAAAPPPNDDDDCTGGPADRSLPSAPEGYAGDSAGNDTRESVSRINGGSESHPPGKPSTLSASGVMLEDSGGSSTKPQGDTPDDGTDKAQTFRKRRLSLTHRLASEDSVSIATASPMSGNAEGEIDSGPFEAKEEAGAGVLRAGSGQGQQQQFKPSLSAMNRRLSEASTGSLASSSSWQHGGPANAARLPCTIMHASELLGHNGGPPPSPALHNDSILYRAVGQMTASKSAVEDSVPTQHRTPTPPSFFLLPPQVADLPETPTAPSTDENAVRVGPAPDSDTPMVDPTALESHGLLCAPPAPGATIQPRWKKRHVLTDEDQLPFPKHLVGMYSCHGMEPIYDDDDDDENDENANDGDVYHRGCGVDEGNALDLAGWTFPPPLPLSAAVTTAMDGGVMQLQFTPVRTSPSLDVKDSETELVSHERYDMSPPSTPIHTPQAPAESQPDQIRTGTRLPPRPIHPVKATAIAKINQDRGGVAYPYGNCPRTALFAVYDGHGQGGELVSQFALSEIQRRLVRHPDFPKPQSFVETFMKVDEALRHEPLIDPNFAGTTACVVLMKDDELIVGNVGDSRAVIARRMGSPRVVDSDPGHGFTAIQLTEDQNPDAPGELERITTAGGYVTGSPSPGLSSRVWLDASCTQIGLAMSRSIGDHSVSRIGVIAEPVVTTYQVDAYDEFLILASDGVWEFLESQEAVDVVARNLQVRDDASKACQALIEAAAQRWHEEEGDYRDDITAIVVRLQHVWKEPIAISPNSAPPVERQCGL